MNEKTILITGGAGFIGSHLAENLLKDGYTVKILDDFSNGNVNNILGLFNYKKFKLIRGSVTDKQVVNKATRDANIVLHLAAQIHVDKSIIEPLHTFEVNTLGTLNILDSVMENNTDLLVYASTSEVYGTGKFLPINEDHPLNPTSPYAATKTAADRLCFSYHLTYNLPVVIMRNFNTYGPRQKDHGYAAAIPKFIKRVLSRQPPVIYGDGLQTRDYLYIKDAIKAYKLIIDNYEDVIGLSINFGTGREIKILELAKYIIKQLGCDDLLTPIHVAPRSGETKRLVADISLARKKLGFSPDYSLEDGLNEYIKWYNEGHHEEWISYIT